MAVSSMNSACPRSPCTCAADSGRREPSRSRSYNPSESTRARVPVRSAGAPGVDPTTQGGHPCGQAAHRSTAGRLDYLAPASPDKKAPPNPGSPLAPPGPPCRCTAGSGSPGALRGRPHHNLVGPRGPSLRGAGPTSPASPTERPHQRRNLSPRVRQSAAAPAAILVLSVRSQPVFTAQICRYSLLGRIPGVQEPSGMFRAMPIV
ncbi:hypothetical protein NDU88_003886 [Pleurodeles waltl]|uniref:Uncharacterized protein n=1 Tax=Pleurodeles waltl TaxID=8319 RepID=A0AAV7UE35_PLEWA|nr:hypothetical protein NDU88_003886 [Pleurodeles waltl]